MIKSKNAKPNIITYNCVIDCCIKCDNFKLAYDYFNYLIEINKNRNKNMDNTNNLNLDIVTFSTLIKGELHKHCFNNAKNLMKKMMEFDYIKLDCILLNTILDGCEKCNCYQEALDIFYLFKKRNVTVNMMTYSLLLKILGVIKDFDNSLKLFEEMKKDKNITINLIIITCFIKTCVSTGHIKEALITFNSIKKYGLNPDTISYITVINGIIKNNYNSMEYAKEIIYLVKESINDGIIFQNNFYMKIINYIKNNAPNLSNDFIQYLQNNEIFFYQHKENNKNIYNYNELNNNMSEGNVIEK
jgi:pentatricopeptide repeat protein